MFSYTGEITELSHYIISNFVKNKNVAVDATLGNGHDTDFLKENFNKVYAFDIQKDAVERYNLKIKASELSKSIPGETHQKSHEESHKEQYKEPYGKPRVEPPIEPYEELPVEPLMESSGKVPTDKKYYGNEVAHDTNLENVITINDSHEFLCKYINEKIDCIIYNLGYLPGGDKSITTKASSTIESLKQAVNLLGSGGFIIICLYIGHYEGTLEKEAIYDFLKGLPKNVFGVMSHTYVNRSASSPELIVIEKK